MHRTNEMVLTKEIKNVHVFLFEAWVFVSFVLFLFL